MRSDSEQRQNNKKEREQIRKNRQEYNNMAYILQELESNLDMIPLNRQKFYDDIAARLKREQDEKQMMEQQMAR